MKSSAWTATKADGTKVRIGVAWDVIETGQPVFVNISTPGTPGTRSARGTMRVERTFDATGGKLHSVIRSASVSSLGGDVVGTGRSLKAAAEEYASRVAQELTR